MTVIIKSLSMPDGMDITPYIAFQGVKWQRFDVDGDNAGRTIGNASMERDRIATKYRLDITCTPLEEDIAQQVLRCIKDEYVLVTYTDPELGLRTDVEMYSNNIPATYCIRRNGKDYWMGITFPLVER